MRITKNLSTKESREFWREWESTIAGLTLDDIKSLPSLGEAWWEAETELSASLLDIKV